MIGPKELPTTFVPNCWKKNKREIIPMIIPTVKVLPGAIRFSKPPTPLNHSTADATEIGGVIIPSANKVPAPIIAGTYNHLR